MTAPRGAQGRSLAATPHGSAWRQQAACREAPDPEVFAPGGGSGGHLSAEVYQAAQTFCAACPVRAECAAEADANRHLGLWGGAWRYAVGGFSGYRVKLLVRRGVA